MFSVTMLPAAEGDCLWIEYGSGDSRHRIVIDCGTSPTYKKFLKQRLDGLGARPYVDLLMVTHVDTDHIGGVLKMLNACAKQMDVGEVWFNAWRHIAPDSLDMMGGVDGEILTAQLDKAGWKWNESFRWTPRDHSVRVPAKGRLPSYHIDGGMALTVVAPGTEQLATLRKEWRKVVREAGLVRGVASKRLVFKAKRKGVKLDLMGGDSIRAWADRETKTLDKTPANGSSIAVLAEFEHGGVTKSCLFSGDAHGPVLAEGVKRLAKQRGQAKLKVDAFKLPQHGSLFNVTRELLEAVECSHYLISSSGAKYDHPDREALARVLMYGSKRATLHFNYRTKFSRIWDNRDWQERYKYKVKYGDGALAVVL